MFGEMDLTHEIALRGCVDSMVIYKAKEKGTVQRGAVHKANNLTKDIKYVNFIKIQVTVNLLTNTFDKTYSEYLYCFS